jgi:PD-(D/E)XK nuclease superfamily
MELKIKTPDHIVPEYSLTGDLLSYQRCNLQYRYYNGSALPPSRPVQLWYGEFIHGVLESAYRIWATSGTTLEFPWPISNLPPDAVPSPPPDGLPLHDIRVIGWAIEATLMQEGKRARSRRARLSAYRRAAAAINMLGPHLFPLIATAEQKVIGTRAIPQRPDGVELRAQRYTVTGVIDVLGQVALQGAPADNVVAEAVRTQCPNLRGSFEIIVDYKGSHRPRSIGDRLWDLGAWQVQTYAYLRARQSEALPVAAGILIYVNELAPEQSDLARAQREVRNSWTDIHPAQGSPDWYQIQNWTPGTTAQLSEAYRYARAIRIVPVTPGSVDVATAEFDQIVSEIEGRVQAEAERGRITEAWPATCSEEDTCAACDFFNFCPRPANGADPAEPGDADEGT